MVKAGYDFGKLDERNFVYDKDKGVIHFFGLSPKILDADINPWFIPELGVPGFEILTGNKNVEFEDVKKVKINAVHD